MASSSSMPPSLPDYTADQTEQRDLPDYTLPHETSPIYDAENFNQPLITYHLRATKKDTSHFLSFEPATSNTQPSYEINYRKRNALTFFTRKADISISRIAPSSSLGEDAVVVARADFHDDGGFPYCPRARMTLNTNAEHREDATIEMQSRDWTNWTCTYDSLPCTWTLCDTPRCIELQHSTTPTNPTPPVIARFTYRNAGQNVLAGGEVGELGIWRDALTESVEGREVVVLGCLVVIRHFDRVGKVGRIDGRGGAWGGGFD